MGTVLSMLAAVVIISMILVSGGSRMYFRRKFNVSEHLADIDKAVKRQQTEKRKLHHAHQK